MFIVETEKMGKAPSGRHVRDSMPLLTELGIFRGSISIDMPLLTELVFIAKRGIFSNRQTFRLVFKTCNREIR